MSNDIKADLFDENTLYVALDNHKHGDFQPYFYKSTDRGTTWTVLHDDLPERHVVWRVVQDHVNKDLMFLATEFGIFFTYNGGTNWIQLKGGLPTISFRDLAIQRRENDLVAASFGRSFYILDDYSALREVNEESLASAGALFAPRNAWWYVPRPDLSFGRGPGAQGASHFIAPNPTFGAEITYYVKDDVKSAKQLRKEREKELNKNNTDIAFPGWDSLEMEALEGETIAEFWIKNSAGEVIRKLRSPWKKGMHRIAWDLRFPSPSAISLNNSSLDREPGSGYMASPGTYTVEMYKVREGQIEQVGEKKSFEVKQLYQGTLEGADLEEVTAFWRETEDAIKRISTARISLGQTRTMHKAINKALRQSNLEGGSMLEELNQMKYDLSAIQMKLNGSDLKNQMGEKNDPTIGERLFAVQRTIGNSTYGPTSTATKNMNVIKEEMSWVEDQLSRIGIALDNMRQQIENSGGPVIPQYSPTTGP